MNYSKEIETMQREGYVVLPGMIPADDVEKLLEDSEKFRLLHPDEKKTQYGQGRRLGLAHLEIPAAMKVIMNPSVLSYVTQIFGNSPILMGTLMFERGSQQTIHHDAHFIYTRKPNQMQSVWIALDDIEEDAGPVFIYPKTHLKPYMPYDTLLENPELMDEVFKNRDVLQGKAFYELVDKVFFKWADGLRKIVDDGKIKPFVGKLKKGDVLFFHPHAIHEGSKIQNPKRFRRSIVGHFFNSTQPVWNRTHNVLRGDAYEDKTALKLEYEQGLGVPYVKHPGVVFKDEL